jgi:sec-independent protein translocase protein TatA
MFGRIGWLELVVILVIVILIFGTKKLRNLGGDLGSALRNFKTSMREGETDAEQKTQDKLSGNDDQNKA